MNALDSYVSRWEYNIRATGANGGYVGILGKLKMILVRTPTLKNKLLAYGMEDLVDLTRIEIKDKLWTPSFIFDNDDMRKIEGFGCYIHNLWTERYLFKDLYPKIVPQRMKSPTLMTLDIDLLNG